MSRQYVIIQTPEDYSAVLAMGTRMRPVLSMLGHNVELQSVLVGGLETAMRTLMRLVMRMPRRYVVLEVPTLNSAVFALRTLMRPAVRVFRLHVDPQSTRMCRLELTAVAQMWFILGQDHTTILWLR